jgi:hypothetical protein
VAGSVGTKGQGLLRCLGNFGGFLECLEQLGPNHNYFFQKPRVLLQFLPTCRDRGKIYMKNRGFSAKFIGYNESGIVFQWKKSVDRVHGTTDLAAWSSPWWTSGLCGPWARQCVAGAGCETKRAVA